MTDVALFFYAKFGINKSKMQKTVRKYNDIPAAT